MATPVLGTPQASFSPNPATPGGNTTMTVNATDPDAAQYTVSGDVLDLQGNTVGFMSETLTIEALHIENLVSNPPGLVFTPTGNPLVYTVSGF